MKTLVIFALIACAYFVAGTTALSVATEDEAHFVYVDPVLGSDGAERPIRQKRATCDILSYLNLNHTPCAIHCVFQGKKGGYCSKGVCNCRN